jgi:ParE toxin of type II toxin-antitoxin system, parDE
MMPYQILAGARHDALTAEARLEEEHPGYGPAFTALFEQGVLSAATNPAMYPRTPDGPKRLETREYYIKRFKYRLIYVVQPNELVFVAVHHASRRPSSWVHRTRRLN